MDGLMLDRLEEMNQISASEDDDEDNPSVNE